MLAQSAPQHATHMNSSSSPSHPAPAHPNVRPALAVLDESLAQGKCRLRSDSSSNSKVEEEEQKEKKATMLFHLCLRCGPLRQTLDDSSSSSSSDSEDSSSLSSNSDDDDEDSEDEDDEHEPVKSSHKHRQGHRRPHKLKLLLWAKSKHPTDNSKEDGNIKNKKKKKNNEEKAEVEDLTTDVEAKKEDKPDGNKTCQDHKKLFQRVWNAEDEINLLKKFFHYTKEVGNAHDPNSFFEFSRKNLMKFKKTQLMDKVRRLKKKYENIVVGEKSGKTATFKTLMNENFSLFHI
ncbi:hypothetical protein EJ110_NYTH57833 [Nymphaea thermarum]|nr:hypothetical protein EJ110_NYTH57833 [Nymphaea thermarum]